MDFLKGGKAPSSEALLPTVAQEKTASESRTIPIPSSQQRPTSANKMAFVRRLTLVLTLCMLLFLGAASAGALKVPCHKGAAGQQQQAAAGSLNDLLNRYLPSRFQGTQPVEVAGRASIPQLVKRDDNSTTSATEEPTESATQEPTESATEEPTQSSTSNPPEETTSTPDIPTTSSSPTPTSTPPTTTSVPSSTSIPEPTSETSTPETTAPESTTPESTTPESTTPESTSTSSPPDTTFTTQTSTKDDEPTITASRTSKAIVQTFTHTSDGAVVTITTTTYVDPDAPETTGPVTTKPPPSLQNAASQRQYGGLIAGLMGAMALILLA